MLRFETDMPEASFTKDFDDKDLFLKQIHIRPDHKLVQSRKSIVEHPFGTVKRNMDGDNPANCVNLREGVR